jgi:hypothetical protein
MEAKGPFRYLPAAALVVGSGFACYALIPNAAAGYLVGTIVFSFAELIFSSAVPAAVARIAPAGRRGAYQGAWALVASFSMGSALVLSGALSGWAGWDFAWLAYAALLASTAATLFIVRPRFDRAAR